MPEIEELYIIFFCFEILMTLHFCQLSKHLTQFGNRNRVISPLSVFIPMSLLSYGAQEETKKNILSVIGLRGSGARMAKVGFEKYLNKLAVSK